MLQALWIYERNVLFILCVDPQDIIGVEIACFEESHTDFTLISEQIQGFSFQLSPVAFNIFLQIIYENHLTTVKRNRRHLYF